MAQSDELAFDNAIKSLEATAASAGVHMHVDAAARRLYVQEIRAMSDKLRQEVARGRLTWAQAAEQAQTTRNVIMQLSRSHSTPVGRAFAQYKKPQGRGLDALIAEKTIKLFGRTSSFTTLTQSQQQLVFAEIVASAGRSQPEITRNVSRLSGMGRGVVLLSVAISTYNILTAQNTARAIKRELITTSAGISGSVAAGALAGLACGPGAPVCVTIGAFAGGALAAFGAGYIW